VNFLDERLPRRFWDKVQPCPISGCWLWTGCLTSAGYGLIAFGPTRTSPPRYTHRLTYEVAHGAISEGREIDHKCRVTNCCNPSHLRAVTHKFNMLVGQNPPASNAVAIACVRGHLFDERNTRITPRGGRACRACHRMRVKERKKRKREERRAS